MLTPLYHSPRPERLSHFVLIAIYIGVGVVQRDHAKQPGGLWGDMDMLHPGCSHNPCELT